VPQPAAENRQEVERKQRIAPAGLQEVVLEDAQRRRRLHCGHSRRIGSTIKYRDFGHGCRRLLHRQHDLPPRRRHFHNFHRPGGDNPDSLAFFSFQKQVLAGFISFRDGNRCD